MSELSVKETDLRGLYIITQAVQSDSRGSFREAYQAEKLEALGVPSLKPVQWNISENLRPGIIRGIHAEPWDKYIHVPVGSAFAAVTDLRPDSPTFGRYASFTLDQTNALYISRGFGNAFQALEPNTIYCYLVNAHWSAEVKYPSIRFDDPDIDIAWPLVPGSDDVSKKDRQNPTLREVFPEKFSSAT
jgi:dTDP-4-dehydrorhamnose 3,5-epimerase/reductase